MRGSVTVDEGAIKALRASGSSLLPIGVMAVLGDFERGEAISIRDSDGAEIGRGLSNYSAAETRRIMRRPSTDIETLLGFFESAELIHRDNLVVHPEPR